MEYIVISALGSNDVINVSLDYSATGGFILDVLASAIVDCEIPLELLVTAVMDEAFSRLKD